MKFRVHFVNGETKVFTADDDFDGDADTLMFKEAAVITRNVLYVEECKEGINDHTCTTCASHIAAMTCFQCGNYDHWTFGGVQ